jgi:hypothetical protein
MQVDYVIPTDSLFRPWIAEHSTVFLQTERQCRQCAESWPLDLEFWCLSAGDKQGFTEDCKACLLEKEAWLVRRNARLGRRLKPVHTVEKPCSVCKIIKPLSAEHFKRHHRQSDGFQAMCRDCMNVRAGEKRAFMRLEKEAARLGLPPPPKPARKPQSPRKSRANPALKVSA